MRGTTVQEVADWLRTHGATTIDRHCRQAHWISRLAIVLKQADDLLDVLFGIRSGKTELDPKSVPEETRAEGRGRTAAPAPA